MKSTAGLIVCLLLAACGGGGGSENSGLQVLDFGLVSGSQDSTRQFSVTNPAAVEAFVRIAGAPTSFRFVAASLPVGSVAAGATFSCSVVATPGGPGLLQEDIALEFYDATMSVVTGYTARATVEDVRVATSPGLADFGPVPYGAEIDRLVQLRNNSALSTVRFVAMDFPGVDMSVADPALPFTLAPGQSLFVTLRYRPLRSMAAVDGTATLRSAGADGSVPITVRATPTAGTAVIDFGTTDFVNGLSQVFTVDAIPNVWAIHVEAWRPDVLPPVPGATDNWIVFSLFEDPLGRHHENDWWASHTLAAGLPRSPLPEDQIVAGGGTYRFQFTWLKPGAPQVPVRVRVLLKATPDGAPALTGTLDLNLWIDNGTGLTAVTAPNDPMLQAGLAQCDLILRQEGVQLGLVTYYDSYETTDSRLSQPGFDPIQDMLPKTPGVVPDRINVFVGNRLGGDASRVCGPAVAYSSNSFLQVGYQWGQNLGYVLAHECGHYLGLWHLGQKPMDVAPGVQPPNVMDSTIFGGTAMSPGQGRVIRAHPFVR